jgi:aldehyde dehydrogenase (NAD+)
MNCCWTAPAYCAHRRVELGTGRTRRPLRYHNLDDVIEQANSTEYGLGASVWGPTELAEKIAKRLEAGTVWINEHLTVAPGQPFGGLKQSGIGVENGLAGLLEYTAAQTVVTAKNASSSNLPA